MNKSPLDATLEELDNAAITYTVKRGSRHYHVLAAGLPLIVCSVTPSDFRATHKARSLVRRLIKGLQEHHT